MYLPKMEAVSDFLFFVRPRRFGKSLFLSMVADYYDCENYKDIDEEFQKGSVAWGGGTSEIVYVWWILETYDCWNADAWHYLAIP